MSNNRRRNSKARRIGETVRSLREARAWSQAELAEKSGLDLKTVGRVERGETSGNPDTRFKLAAAFEVSTMALSAARPTGRRDQSSVATVDEYRRNLIRSVTPRIEPNVVLSTTDGDNLVDMILAPHQGRPVYVWGPSGIGKSHAMLAAAKRGAEEGQVPVFARGILFRGAFEEWLTAATAATAAVDFEELRLGAENANARLVVYVDAINEIPPRLVDPMMDGIQGLLWSKGAAVVISGQEETLGKWSSALDAQSARVSAPSPDDFKTLAAAYGLDARVAADLRGILRTPMDVALAAEEWSGAAPRRNRFALLDSFAKRRLRDAPPGTHTLLVAVAGILKARISRTLRQSEFDRLMESSGGQVLRSGLCQMDQGFVSFRHDYFLDYFAAEHILRQQKLADVANLLDTPIFFGLAQLVVEAQSEPGAVLELFDGSQQARGTVTAALAGYLGTDAQIAALTLVDRLRKSVVADIQSSPDPESLQKRSWALAESWVADALGNASQSPIVRESLATLLVEVEDAVAAKTSVDDRPRGSARWFDAMAHPSTGHPVGRALLGARNVLQPFDNAVSRTRAERGGTIPTKRPLMFMLQGYLLLAESRSRRGSNELAEELQQDIVDHVRQASMLRTPYLFSDAMILAHDCADRLTGERRDEMVRVLRAVQPTGGLNDTWLLDALDSYGEVEPAYDVDALYQDVRQILELPFDSAAQGRACGLVAAASEPLSAIHAPHIEAFSRLSTTEVARLRGMAAMGALAQEHGWRNPDEVPPLACEPDCEKEAVAVLALRRWATLVPDLRMMGSQAVLAFVYATEACARMSVELVWSASASAHPEGQVWKVLGSMVYDQTVGRSSVQHWDTLPSIRFDALVPLLWLLAVDDCYDCYSSRRESVRFREVWRIQIARFLRDVLSEPAVLDITGLTPTLRNSPVAAALDVMSEVGDLSDIEWIRRFTTTTTLGGAAVEAIKMLRQRAESQPR